MRTSLVAVLVCLGILLAGAGPGSAQEAVGKRVFQAAPSLR